MDVTAWLRGLGLEQYAPAFRDNDVDGEMLPELTADDLISIGVTSVGHRRKLLAAIAALRVEPTRDLAQPAVSATSTPVSPPISEAERRQLTVMFCDLVDSTGLSVRLDPEDLRAVIGAYHRCVAGVVEHSGGFVAKYMGDGVLAYFGYPRADEHDAERAVRAGLALVAAVPRLDTAAETRLQVRVGIATGIVVVGDLLGQGAAQEQAVVGETPNLAAINTVPGSASACSRAASTRRLTGGLFDYEDLGAARSRGFARGHRRVSPLLRRSHHRGWRIRRQIHGRRRACLFRLSARRRARCRAGGAGRAGAGRGGRQARHGGTSTVAGAGRDSLRSRRGR